jgi:hypothetical protein
MCLVRRAFRLVPVLLTAVCLCPVTAHADGDPASDVLISDDLFVPYEQPSQEQVGKLRGVIAASRKGGQPVRVAVIHSPRDLGAVANLFGHPQEYANLLATELQNPVESGAKGHQEELLIVMPAGFGTKNVPAEVDRKLRGADIAADAGPDDLVAAAGWGVQELAKASGKPVREVFAQPEGDTGGGGLVATVLIVVALLALVGVLVALRMRAGGAPASAEPQSPDANT